MNRLIFYSYFVEFKILALKFLLFYNFHVTSIERAYIYKYKEKENQSKADKMKQINLGIEMGEEHDKENAIQTI